MKLNNSPKLFFFCFSNESAAVDEQFLGLGMKHDHFGKQELNSDDVGLRRSAIHEKRCRKVLPIFY